MIPPLPRLQSADPTFNRFQDYLRQALAQITRNEPWKALSYAANWSNNTSLPGSFFKDSLGFVHLRGLTKYALAGAGDVVICTLPTGYRPSAQAAFPVANWIGTDFLPATAYVNTDGTVHARNWTNSGAGTGSGISLDGISFDTR